YDQVEVPSMATAIEVKADQVTDQIDFALKKITPGAGSIAGTVLTAVDNVPIFQAVVYVFSSDAPYYYGKAQTDSNGCYIITELKSGQYIAEVYAEGYMPEIYDDAPSYEFATKITVEEPNQSGSIDFQLERCGSISGRITDQNNHPIPQVYVTAEPTSRDSLSDSFFPYPGRACTNEDGYYYIANLREGEYFVRADYYASWANTVLWYPDVTDAALAQVVPVQSGQETPNIDFHFKLTRPAGIISGRVTDLSGNAVVNASIQIQLYEPDDTAGRVWLQAKTNREGFFRIDHVPNGSYIASCWAQNGWQTVHRYWPDGETLEQAKIIIIDEEHPSWTIDFRLPLTVATSSISGHVQSPDKSPLSGAFVRLSTHGDNASAQTDANSVIYTYGYTDSSGCYLVDNLPAGEYIAYASYWENNAFGQQWYLNADSVHLATPIILSDNERRQDIHFVLNVRPIYGAIVGTVTDATIGQALNRAYVEIKRLWHDDRPLYRPFAWFPYHAITDDLGQYSLEWLPEGEYLISVYADGGYACYPDAIVPSLAVPVKVIGGEKTSADVAVKLRNDGPGSISGRVTADYTVRPFEPQTRGNQGGQVASPEDAPLEIAVVIAKPAITILVWPQSELSYTAVTDKEGYYVVNGLSDGEYFLWSFAPHHMLQYYKEVYYPAEATLIKIKDSEPVKNIHFNLIPSPYMFLDTPGAKEGNSANGIYGRIVDAQNNTVTNAVIYLLDEYGNPVLFTISDEAGNYEFLGVPAGNYYLQAGKLGYSTTFNGNAQSRSEANHFAVGDGLVEINIILSSRTTEVEESSPESLTLLGNYPNPFNPETTIEFSLPKPMYTEIRIFNTRGQEVIRLQQGVLPTGNHHIKWDGRDTAGRPLGSGLYIYRLETETETKTSKLLLLR
ncbi:carboxypeptidase regulatory-like domain-containing protein, partial [candidate division KSB1 bacterium]|nr:carboxypeptidase regulatory-like domain-containing protein [candidate division KSB1 bacterium]